MVSFVPIPERRLVCGLKVLVEQDNGLADEVRMLRQHMTDMYQAWMTGKAPPPPPLNFPDATLTQTPNTIPDDPQYSPDTPAYYTRPNYPSSFTAHPSVTTTQNCPPVISRDELHDRNEKVTGREGRDRMPKKLKSIELSSRDKQRVEGQVKEIYDNRLVVTSSSCVVATSSSCLVATSSNSRDVSTIDSTEIIDIEFIENTKFSENTGIIDDILNEFVEEDQVYKDKETVVSVTKNLAVRERFQFKVKRSSATRYHLTCMDDNCAWSFKSYAVFKPNIFKVRSYNNNHTCGYGERYLTQRQATSGVIASIVKDKYVNPKKVYTTNDIIEDIQKQHGIEVSYMKAWRAKEIAMAMIRGSPSDSYKELPKYFYMLEQTNPGTVTKLHKSEDECFLYAYVSLYASIKGWEHCRPIMVVGGNFLKAAYKGTILTACTHDGAVGKILPLAYAIVDSENNKSWEWFFVQIKGTFGVREGMCIVSDRNESIFNATKVVYPEVPHCICMFHLWQNVKRTFKKHHKQLKDIFFALARAYTIEKFEYHMTEMCKIDPRVQPYLFDIGYERWSRAYSKVKRSMVMTSNIAESINAANKDARELPVMRLLEYMTNLLQQWNNKNRKSAMETSTELGEKYDKLLRENLIASEQMMVRPATEQLYTVFEGVRRNIACLEEGTCSCEKFQMDELPCPHAWAVLKN
ncbi:PREDICTED: uncharacterized protein LOC109222135 [Nicotiana attenuata]|uniref:uncharacterized protein LOC109222135 n=1 Tax=Nicotiana attenuata TaxID=49451 RepID=UPI00090590DF|nr:PREDICTED: uncharacterized protein LOC109222135 [Nicotiana attenuata]